MADNQKSALRRAGRWILDTLILTDKRKLKGKYRKVARLLCGFMGLFYFYTAGFGVFSPASHLGVFFGGTLALVYLYFPFSKKKSPLDRFTITDLVLALFSIAIGLYFTWDYDLLAGRNGVYNDFEVAAGVAAIIISIEGARRSVGMLLPVTAIAALLYAWNGVSQKLPMIIAHPGFTWKRISTFMFTSTDGILGTVDYTLATYVMIFVIFGAFLNSSGVGKFFIDFCHALLGRSPSGTAQVAVAGSALFGCISGSPVANVVTTGSLTIPLMKRAGYAPETAGAIESVASTGAMFTPPVMGAAAFFMVEFTGIPYSEIMIVAAIPALLYYIGVWLLVWLEANKKGLRDFDASQVPNPWKILKEGWFLVIPLVLMVTLLLNGYSPSVSAFWACVACFAISWFTKANKMTPKVLAKTFADAGNDILIIAAITGAIGIIVGILVLSGLGLRFSDAILSLSQGNLLLTIVYIGIAAFILGMGAPIAAVYVILAVIAPAALVDLGVPLISAHMLLIWYSQMSGLTPPVALVAYAASAIAGSDPIKTGVQAMKYGFYLALIPLLFIYTPLLLTGTPFENGLAIVTSFFAVIATAFVIQRWFLRKNTWLEQILFGVGAFLLYTPSLLYSLIGLGLVLIAGISHYLTRNPKEAAIPTAKV
jgi:TRAP transporter 4TM/12TM fusion protein